MKKIVFLIAGGIWQRFMVALVAMAEQDITYDEAYFNMTYYDTTATEGDFGQPFMLKIKDAIDKSVSAMSDYGIENPYDYCSHYVLNQNIDDFKDAQHVFPNTSTYFNHNNKIEDFAKLPQLKALFNKIPIHQHLLDEVDQRWQQLELDEKTLSVHCRLTSLTTIPEVTGHPMYGWKTTEDYFKFIDEELITGKYNKIFVSSDNDESIEKLKKRYGSLIRYNDDFKTRYKVEFTTREDVFVEYHYQFTKPYWVETFLDVYMLAKGKAFICRGGNFSNASILRSNSFEKIIRIV